MQFVHQALTWGFLLALVPVLIHLINMMRHQRVRWAAMDFLLASYKKHRKWVWLKQLLLLLARMAIVALVVAMLAQWVTRRQWANLLGGAATHHYILVDDSYSMSDRQGGSSAFDLARQVVSTIGTRAAEAETAQQVTLIRFSQAARAAMNATGEAGDAATRLALAADFNSEPIDSNFAARLEEKRSVFEATQLAVGPRSALELVRQLLDGGVKETPLVYVVSDFRAGQWDKPAEVRELLLEVQRLGASVELVQCAKALQSNLAITDIQPVDETRAAGVPLFVNVTIKNFGAETARRVPLKVRTVFTPPDAVAAGDVERAWESVADLATAIIEELPGGQSVTKRVQVFFPKPGQQVVEAELPDDAVLADNRRWTVIDFPDGEAALLIDGSAKQLDAYYLAAVFQPSENANTGVRTQVKTPAFLRDARPEELAAFRSIYLLDVDRLDETAVKNLEQFARSGGGVAFFAGPNTNQRFYTDRLYRKGEGLYPVPLEREDALPPPTEEGTPDIDFEDHPVFAPFVGERNPFVRLVRIDRFVRPPSTWSPPAGSTVQVISRLRSRAPLIVEQAYGSGRVVALLTSVSPAWNNWAQDPSFVIFLLRLQSHLASGQRPLDPRVVGAPLEVDFDAQRFREELRWVVPGAKRGARVPLERTAVKKNAGELESVLGQSAAAAAATDSTDRAGVYEAWPQTRAGSFELRRFAVNVDPEEGDLALLDGQTLLSRLAPLKAGYQQAEQFQAASGDLGGVNRSLLVMALLIALLLGEQFLAYVLSYHPPAAAAAAPSVPRFARRTSTPEMNSPSAQGQM
ncbi:MAG: BatA domain-containing protein [Pirellulales bacterium]